MGWLRTGAALATGGGSELWRAGHNAMTGNNQSGSGMSMAEQQRRNDMRIQEGLARGQDRGQAIYGQSGAQTSQDVQDIVGRRKEMVEGEAPYATRQREARNRQVRMAKAAGASDEQLRQIERENAADIANIEYGQYQQNLGAYQNLVGNILKGQQGMEFGYGNLYAAGNTVQAPQSGGGIFGTGGLGSGTVICTEMWRNGYMSDDMYAKDQAYGLEIIKNTPEVYEGYRILADPVVSLMQKSKTFTWLISFPAMAWARNMAGESNIVGKLINKYGEKLCGFVGRNYGKIQEANDQQA